MGQSPSCFTSGPIFCISRSLGHTSPLGLEAGLNVQHKFIFDGLIVGLDDGSGLFQPLWFSDSVTRIHGCSGDGSDVGCEGSWKAFPTLMAL